ncbi:AI-2E family transporter [Garciella nitratireducens]|uniref:AI-2E family transporter n=1 Tax=Garciella nitratireducens TaxID=218205 RepID=UPI000B3F3598|nr:AI-2E family transporter [Garciella nitratireducens]
MTFLKRRRNLFFLIIIGVLFFMLIFHIRKELISILSPFIWSIIFAYLLNPIVNFLETRKINRSLSILLTYLTLISIFIVIGWTIIPAIVDETKNLIHDLPYYTEQVEKFLLMIRKSTQAQLPVIFNNFIENSINSIEDSIINKIKSISYIVVNFFSGILNIVMIPVVTYYFLKDKEYFKKIMIELMPKKWRIKILEIAKDSDRVIGGFVRGKIIVAIFVGVFTALGLYLLNINYAVIIGVVTGIIDIIPYFGPVIAAIPAIIIAFFQHPIKAIWVIILFIIVQQIEGDVIGPKVIGSSVGLHPVAIIFSLLIGGTFFGVIGMILAVPVAGTVKVVGKHIVDYIATNDDNY